MLSFILLGEFVNLSCIIMKKFIKVYWNPLSSLIYSNVLTKLFKKGVDLFNESERIIMKDNYDVYSEKHLGACTLLIEMVYRSLSFPRLKESQTLWILLHLS